MAKTKTNRRDSRSEAEPRRAESACPQCGSRELQKFGSMRQEIPDTPRLGRPSKISVDRRRYRCKLCSATFFEPLSGVDEKRSATVELVRYIEAQSLGRTFTSIAEEVGVAEGTVRNIFHDYVEGLAAAHPFVTPVWLGVDEIKLNKATRLLLTNLKQGTVFDLLARDEERAVSDCLLRLPAPEAVEIVSMGMSKAASAAVRRRLPRARIVVDKLHVERLASEVLARLRKEMAAGAPAGARRHLMSSRFILSKRRRDLDAAERSTVDSWSRRLPRLREAYMLKEEFLRIYNSKGAAEARRRYREWEGRLSKDMSRVFRPLVAAVKSWDRELFAYMDHRVANVVASRASEDGYNLARGYSFEVIRANMLFTCGFKPARASDARSRPKESARGVTYGPPVATVLDKLERGSL